MRGKKEDLVMKKKAQMNDFKLDCNSEKRQNVSNSGERDLGQVHRKVNSDQAVLIAD